MKKAIRIACISTLTVAICLTGEGGNINAAASDSYYRAPVTANKQWQSGQLQLTAGKVTVSAYTGTETGFQGTPFINKLHITDGRADYDIPLKGSVISLRSISVSPSGQYIAVHIFLEAGSQLLIVDLAHQKHILINDNVRYMKYAESVPVYNWSPVGDQLAFAYGDTSSSRVAIYHAASGKIEYVPRETNIISTSAVLWNSKGTVLDYISEYSSNHFKLYRYTLSTKKVKPIKSLTRKQMQQLSLR
ncbi:hypothetical protein [Paenibacillus wulumuqiensis]|uniref:hypothetical protein n=1 Tax=Paenibacillus wulumuqiensis TaxID=1567107 RepID=UPI0006972C52|nr:hypothetical protein [Paenibacillus wulumuqiensis]